MSNKLRDAVLARTSDSIENALRWIWDKTTRFVLGQTGRTVSITRDMPAYRDLADWMASHPSSAKCTDFQWTLGATPLTPTATTRLFQHGGRYVLVQWNEGIYQHYGESESGKAKDIASLPDSGVALVGGQMGGIVSVTLFGARRGEELTAFLTEVQTEMASRRTLRRYHTVYQSRGGGWERLFEKPLRPAASVILPEGESVESLIADVEHFFAERDWYENMGIPHRRGYLFEGVAGTGKTSSILAIAAALGKDISVLRLSDPNIDDVTLTNLLHNMPNGSVLLLEDIDAAFTRRVRIEGDNGDVREVRAKRTMDAEGLTFSGLLNALDGALAAENRVIFMTTNHVEQLDPALIRPGRVDKRITFGYATASQATRLYERFFPGARADNGVAFGELVAHKGTVTMAQVQEYLLRYRDDADLAYLNSDELTGAAGSVPSALPPTEVNGVSIDYPTTAPYVSKPKPNGYMGRKPPKGGGTYHGVPSADYDEQAALPEPVPYEIADLGDQHIASDWEGLPPYTNDPTL